MLMNPISCMSTWRGKQLLYKFWIDVNNHSPIDSYSITDYYFEKTLTRTRFGFVKMQYKTSNCKTKISMFSNCVIQRFVFPVQMM